MAGRGGFLVLDEPEAALSLMSQISLANKLAQLSVAGIQVLTATHSPVLAATPGARIIELDETGFEPRTYHELTTVALYRRFLTDPGFFGVE